MALTSRAGGLCAQVPGPNSEDLRLLTCSSPASHPLPIMETVAHSSDNPMSPLHVHEPGAETLGHRGDGLPLLHNICDPDRNT